MEKNQDGFVWQYVYDPLMRLQQQTDPDGIVRTPTYDAVGRVLFVNFSTGRQDSFDCDANDNPQTVSRRFSGVTTATQFIYDSLDRVVEQDDALGQTVLYGHDPLGRVTSITYPGSKTLTDSYDALGRLTAQTDWAGRQMSYTYDLSDRLISRTYPNGVIQTNSFDTSGRITGLSYSPSTVNSNSVNIALAYAYDHNGNKTGGGESGTFNWPQPSLTTDQSSFTPAGRLISRQITETSPSNSVNAISYHYDASGNMTNATGDGQTWALTYDEDNRTTSINWDCGLTTVLVSNRYDALGRRISKTANGVTTGYVLDLSSGMERILCDLDGNGNVSAWYVHGPDLCYRVDATNGLICYHSDAMGNVIALTDGNTNLVAQYAYTPYGRSLGSTNTLSSLNSQTYTFVGSQGVQVESGIPNLYFMRARYYSADAGVFLSTDPQKKIGPGWLPQAYNYAQNSPLQYLDPNGESVGSQTLGGVKLIGEFINPVNYLYPIGGLIVYGIGAVEHNQTLMNEGEGDNAIPIQNITSDLEETTGGKVNSELGGYPINDQMAKSYFADSSGGYEAQQTVMNYGNLALTVLDVADLASSVTEASQIIAKGDWGQVGGYLEPVLANNTAQVLSDAAGLSPASSPSINNGQNNSGGGGNQPMIAGAVNAVGHAQTMNASQQVAPAMSSMSSGTTTQSSGGGTQSSGGNVFTQTVNTITSAVNYAAGSISSAVSHAATTVGQAISSAVSSAWSAFERIF